jgi:serine/threonine-protein kinase
MSVRRCPRCQATFAPPARFCARDGTPLVDVQGTPAGPPNEAVRRSEAVSAHVTPPAAISFNGQTIGDRYKVIRRLGEGGMSYVYLARDLVRNEDRAVKILTPRLATDPGSTERLRREALLAKRFDHRNVCSILDVGETAAGHIFLVMPYLRGESLNNSEMRRGPYPLGEGLQLLRQLCDGLQHAHDLGVVHRDLKPENVMLVPDKTAPGEIRAVVTDFGLAKALQADRELVRLTQTGIVLGTPEFMSPEQVHGRTIDGRSDIFALAVLAFELFTGQLPFEGRNSQETMLARLRGKPKSLRSVRADLPAQLDAVVAKALAADPSERHQSMALLADALDEVSDGGFLSRWLKR